MLACGVESDICSLPFDDRFSISETVGKVDLPGEVLCQATECPLHGGQVTQAEVEPATLLRVRHV